MDAPFPSLLIHADRFEPQGTFARAQAAYLEPDPEQVAALARLLEQSGVGLVAHFYMDAELQGTLSAVAALLGASARIHVADSLQMADRAVLMAEQGAKAIVVLGVDFMSENVRATLDATGHKDVPVYRVSQKSIGCSLAESAEALAYGAYLQRAARTPRALHVVYVNTSLRVKARAQKLLPTITCTSSNVLPLILQAFAQVPDLHVFFGPDTYMGQNLASMLDALAGLDAVAIAKLHPGHTPESLRAARKRFSYFEQGVCIVHHMFGDAVVDKVRRDYNDAFITAHLEVPGEMFALGWEAQRKGRGVVGSTSNILDFIDARVSEATRSSHPEHLRFILGTESGMTTPIARRVQAKLKAARSGATAEVIFPVAAEAIATTGEEAMPIVPGIAAGEGCSTAGGCATCPYMKMNSLDALLDLLQRIDRGQGAELKAFEPKTYAETLDGHSIAELGSKTILSMRAFQKTGTLPAELVQEITRSAN